jgi:uncharacterized membrane protein
VVLLASLAGLAISVYLTVAHYSTIPLACPTGAVFNCEQVLSSRFAVIGGSALPTSAAGIAWFAISAGLAIAVLRYPRRQLGRIQLPWSAIGLVTVIYLLFVEIVQLGAICLWCTAAHVLVLLIFLIALSRPDGGRVRM